MKKYFSFLAVSAGLFGFVLLAQPIQAQSPDPVGDQAKLESAVLLDEPESLDGVQLLEPKNIPSGFGFWWNDLKENLSLALTLDPVKKAEKQLQFAAQRVKMAQYMIENSADPKIQEKAQQLLARGNEYVQKIEERKNKLVQNSDQERVRLLLQNAAKHQLNLELLLDKIEDKIPGEELEAFQQWREQVETRQRQFLDSLKDDQGVSQAVKDKIAEVKARIQLKLEDREAFRVQQSDILEEIKAGREEAKAALEELREERKQALEKAREEYKTEKEEIIDRLNSGEKNAVRELIQLNQAKKAEVKKIEQELKIKAAEIKNELKNEVQEDKDELRQNRIRQREQASPSASATPNVSASPSLSPSPSPSPSVSPSPSPSSSPTT